MRGFIDATRHSTSLCIRLYCQLPHAAGWLTFGGHELIVRTSAGRCKHHSSLSSHIHHSHASSPPHPTSSSIHSAVYAVLYALPQPCFLLFDLLAFSQSAATTASSTASCSAHVPDPTLQTGNSTAEHCRTRPGCDSPSHAS